MGYIYKITNQVNGKMYIGKTEYLDPLKRWKRHLEDYKKQKIGHRPLYYAMRKYGIENFEFQVIDQTDNSDVLCELEQHYIKEYRTYINFEDSNGYNATLGGDGKSYIKLDEEAVIKIHMDCQYISGITAKQFGVDPDVIQKILSQHNVKWLTQPEIAELRFKEKYGGLVQIDPSGFIVDIYNSTTRVIDKNPSYKYKTLNAAYVPSARTHMAYGYIWYRLRDIPEEYKPLLDEYYKSQEDINE